VIQMRGGEMLLTGMEPRHRRPSPSGSKERGLDWCGWRAFPTRSHMTHFLNVWREIVVAVEGGGRCRHDKKVTMDAAVYLRGLDPAWLLRTHRKDMPHDWRPDIESDSVGHTVIRVYPYLWSARRRCTSPLTGDDVLLGVADGRTFTSHLLAQCLPCCCERTNRLWHLNIAPHMRAGWRFGRTGWPLLMGHAGRSVPCMDSALEAIPSTRIPFTVHVARDFS